MARELPAPFTGISDDAVALAKGLFAIGAPDFTLTFGSHRGIPSDRTAAALAELVKVGAIFSIPNQPKGVLSYGKVEGVSFDCLKRVAFPKNSNFGLTTETRK